jgi:hypothetical protein
MKQVQDYQELRTKLTNKDIDKLYYSLVVLIMNSNNVSCLDNLTSKQQYYWNTELELLKKLEKLK